MREHFTRNTTADTLGELEGAGLVVCAAGLVDAAGDCVDEGAARADAGDVWSAGAGVADGVAD